MQELDRITSLDFDFVADTQLLEIASSAQGWQELICRAVEYVNNDHLGSNEVTDMDGHVRSARKRTADVVSQEARWKDTKIP